MVGIQAFPTGMEYYFQGRLLLVSGRVYTWMIFESLGLVINGAYIKISLFFCFTHLNLGAFYD